MPRYFITFAYNGKNYVGWQVQPNGTSVQQVLQDALSTILRGRVEIVGAGRTDAGVHARRMVAHFDWEGDIFQPGDLVYKLNNFSPERYLGNYCTAGDSHGPCPFQCHLAYLFLSYHHRQGSVPA